ncbi:MAG: hypothetical protein JWO05_1920 [Gemmatimonadetes bacterium]|nr:hypothetical protein [Gemmatimonadota bacterium]
MPTPVPALEPDFSDLLREFSDRRVDYLVAGAHADALNGEAPRAAGALEIFVSPNPANAERVLQALVAFGANIEAVSRADLLDVSNMLVVGESPLRVEIRAVERDYGRRRIVNVEDIAINFVDSSADHASSRAG